MIHIATLPRIAVSATLGLPLTLLLFLLMTVLIKSDEARIETAIPLRLAEFVRLIEEEPPVRKTAPTPPPVPEPTPQTRVPEHVDPTGFGHEIIGLGPIGEHEVKVQVGMTDGDAVPLVTSPPEYPARAVQRGIEGWVLVEFSIDALGRVFDPRVIDAQPRGIFDRAAMQAVERYKYRPRVVNGEPITVAGVRQRISFELSNRH